jgi:hypothetical protein
MAEEVVEFADNETLVQELTSRDTFPGIVVFQNGYRNNQDHGSAPKLTPRVEISSGLTNQAAAEMLLEVHKVLSQFVVTPITDVDLGH